MLKLNALLLNFRTSNHEENDVINLHFYLNMSEKLNYIFFCTFMCFHIMCVCVFVYYVQMFVIIIRLKKMCF